MSQVKLNFVPFKLAFLNLKSNAISHSTNGLKEDEQ
jgi:hypothetical protein